MNRSLSRSYTYCTELTRARAGNFYYAFLLLPRVQRRAMHALYAFMRCTDDLADGAGSVEERRTALVHWRQGLQAALEGRGDHPVHPALREAVLRHQVRIDHLHALIDGVESDLMRGRFNTFAELYQYCYQVASVVGLICLRIWGCRAPEAERYAEWSGIAFQLTNILRDVTEDAACGRIYLPQDELRIFGCSESQLEHGPCDEAYQRLMQFQVQRARNYYEQARPLVDYLMPAGRSVFQIMTRIYRSLLESIDRRGFAAIHERARLAAWRKLSFVARAVPVRMGLIP